jgi:hypothetical protein
MKLCWLTTGAWEWSAADGCMGRNSALILVRPATAAADDVATAEEEEEAVGGGAGMGGMHHAHDTACASEREPYF